MRDVTLIGYNVTCGPFPVEEDGTGRLLSLVALDDSEVIRYAITQEVADHLAAALTAPSIELAKTMPKMDVPRSH